MKRALHHSLFNRKAKTTIRPSFQQASALFPTRGVRLPALLVAAILITTIPVFAQTEKQESDTTGYNAIIPVSKQGLLRDVDVIMNMQYALRNEFVDGKYTGSNFNMNQWRLEIKGKVADKVYFRLRQRYTRSVEPQSQDNMTRATDIAMIRVDVSPKVSISAGKLCADFGGIEFDLNPIDIYEYADILEQADNFLAGVGASWRPGNGKNEFNFQV